MAGDTDYVLHEKTPPTDYAAAADIPFKLEQKDKLLVKGVEAKKIQMVDRCTPTNSSATIDQDGKYRFTIKRARMPSLQRLRKWRDELQPPKANDLQKACPCKNLSYLYLENKACCGKLAA